MYMTHPDRVGLKLVIKVPGVPLQQLRTLRLELFAELDEALSGEAVELSQAADGRSLDPNVVGAVGILLSPVLPAVIETLGVLLDSFIRRHQDCTVTVKALIPQRGEVEIKFNPLIHSLDEILKLLAPMDDNTRLDKG